jgi:hypothetical protein
MGTVYVVQNPMRYDPEKGRIMPRYDLAPAERFGKLRVLFDERTTLRPEEAKRIIAKMNLVLRSFCDEDYLLLIGNPALIGYATGLAAAHNGGKIKLLVWSGREKDYTVVESRLPILSAPDRGR